LLISIQVTPLSDSYLIRKIKLKDFKSIGAPSLTKAKAGNDLYGTSYDHLLEVASATAWMEEND